MQRATAYGCIYTNLEILQNFIKILDPQHRTIHASSAGDNRVTTTVSPTTRWAGRAVMATMGRSAVRYFNVISGAACIIALAGCGEKFGGEEAHASEAAAASQGQPATASVAAQPAKAALTTEDRAAIMKAAGYQLVGGSWTSGCGEVGEEPQYTGSIALTQDLTGDGVPEAIVQSDGSMCFGNTGTDFHIVRKEANRWVSVFDVIGVPTIFSTPKHKAPNIEIGGPGSYCFGMVRWNGKEFALAGFSVAGKICEELRPSKIGGLPMGYYQDQQFCGYELTEACIGYLGQDRFVTLSSGDFVSMRPAGAGQFMQTVNFPAEDGGPGDVITTTIKVLEGNSFQYGNSTYYFVPLDQVPREARLLDLRDFRDDPRFKPLRAK